ncbi:MAG: hypothetical protein IJQ81_08370 [Oscillibacter sp.]|nr:hypothetical protein [Oscillibacter sp.]
MEGAENFDELEDTEEPTVNEDGEEQEWPANADEGAFDGPDYSDCDNCRDEYGDGRNPRRGDTRGFRAFETAIAGILRGVAVRKQGFRSLSPQHWD